jgi:glyoxylase-like metal-dependent hydrolase (beta-lactamase superfamily II)
VAATILLVTEEDDGNDSRTNRHWRLPVLPVGCEDTSTAALIDPEISQIDHYLALAARDGLRIRYLIDTHTHADHFSATRQLARKLAVPVVMYRTSAAPFVDMRIGDGEMLMLGRLRLQVMHTPGHTSDSMCLQIEDSVFTGDTLLIGGTGRTDLPERRSGGPLRQPLQAPPEARPKPQRFSRRTTTRAGKARPSARRSPATRACRSATVPLSST